MKDPRIDFWEAWHRDPPTAAEWPLPERYARLEGCRAVEEVEGFGPDYDERKQNTDVYIIIRCPDREAAVDKRTRKTKREVRLPQ